MEAQCCNQARGVKAAEILTKNKMPRRAGSRQVLLFGPVMKMSFSFEKRKTKWGEMWEL
jgi:hypothetical protein